MDILPSMCSVLHLIKIYVMRNNVAKIKTWNIKAVILIKVDASYETHLFIKLYYDFFLIKFMK